MSKLFSALRIGQLELTHRLVTPLRAEPRFDVSDYRRRASAGGLVIVESTVEEALDESRWRLIAEAIHDADLEDRKFGREEGLVINRILQGWAKQKIGDHELLKRGIDLIEGLYVSIA